MGYAKNHNYLINGVQKKYTFQKNRLSIIWNRWTPLFHKLNEHMFSPSSVKNCSRGRIHLYNKEVAQIVDHG